MDKKANTYEHMNKWYKYFLPISQRHRIQAWVRQALIFFITTSGFMLFQFLQSESSQLITRMSKMTLTRTFVIFTIRQILTHDGL